MQHSNIIILTNTQTQTRRRAFHTQIFGRLFLSGTVIHHSGRHRRHQHDDNDDDADDDDDADAITTLTLNHPPLHQHQESDSLLVWFAAKV